MKGIKSHYLSNFFNVMTLRNQSAKLYLVVSVLSVQTEAHSQSSFLPLPRSPWHQVIKGVG